MTQIMTNMKFIIRFLKGIFWDPTLPLTQKCRKAIYNLVLLTWVIVILDVVIGVSLRGSFTQAFISDKVGNLFLSVFLPFGLVYGYAQQNDLHDYTILFFLYIGIVGTLLSILTKTSTRAHDANVLALLLLVHIQFASSYFKHTLALVAVYLVHVYNSTFAINGYPPARVMEPQQGLTEDLLSHIRGIVILTFAVVAVNLHIRAYTSTSHVLEVAVSVAKAVSEHLTEYNTSAAESVLRQYSISPEFDKDLFDVLTNIVNNLKKYKPFLPNYLVHHDKEEEDDGMEADPSTPVTMAPLSSQSESMQSESDTSSQDDRPSSSTTTTPRHRGRQRSVVTFSGSNTNNNKSNVDGSKSKVFPSANLLEMVPMRKCVSYTLIDFTFFTHGLDKPEILRNFIDNLFTYANTTNGAVHTCVGNTVHLTWNAVQSVKHAEFYAVGIFQYLRKYRTRRQSSLTSSPSQKSYVSFCGSVATGVGECRTIGTHFQAFLLNIDWKDVLQSLQRYARRVKTNVVCSRTAKAIREPTMLVDIVGEDEKVEVYEITTTDKKTKYGQSIKRALEAWGEGDCERASKELGSPLLHRDGSITGSGDTLAGDNHLTGEDGKEPASVAYLRRKFFVVSNVLAQPAS